MKPNFQKFLTRKYSVLMDDIIIHSWLDSNRFFKLSGVKEYVKDIEIINGDFCFDVNWMSGIVKKYQNKKPDFFWHFCKKGYLYGEKLKKFVRNLNLKKEQKELKKYFWKSIELLKDLMVFVPETHPLAKIVENVVRNILILKNINKNNFEETLIILTQPKKLNTPILEQKDLQRISLKQKNLNFNVHKALKEHFKKYSFLGYREPFSKGFDLSFFKKRLREDFSLKNEQEKIKIKFNNNEKKWIELMKEMVYFRNYRTEKMCEAFFYLETLWDEIGKDYGLEKNTFAHYQIFEVHNLFAKGQKIIKEIINDRANGHGFLVHNRKIKFITGKELSKKIAEYNPVNKKIKEVKGFIACKGLIKGLAKIVLSSNKQSKVKKGEILVTTMTTPDFLPSMRRASAFVTDEGGITCHAAIVAREMKKPCIIGTKIATQVLRDGDLVEVDADEGVIKILTNKK